MKALARMVVRGILGIIGLAVVLSGLVVVSLIAMYSDRHATLS